MASLSLAGFKHLKITCKKEADEESSQVCSEETKKADEPEARILVSGKECKEATHAK